MTNLEINIGIVQALSIIFVICGSLISIAWYASSRFTALETSLTWIKDDLVKLWGSIKGKEAKQQGLEAPGSPLNPTQKGWDWLNESGLSAIIDNEPNRSSLIEKMRAKLPNNYTEYDVQELANEVLSSLKDDPMMSKVKEYAFNNGLDYDLILRLWRLLLRDNFLGSKHTIVPDKPNK